MNFAYLAPLLLSFTFCVQAVSNISVVNNISDIDFEMVPNDAMVWIDPNLLTPPLDLYGSYYERFEEMTPVLKKLIKKHTSLSQEDLVNYIIMAGLSGVRRVAPQEHMPDFENIVNDLSVRGVQIQVYPAFCFMPLLLGGLESFKTAATDFVIIYPSEEVVNQVAQACTKAGINVKGFVVTSQTLLKPFDEDLIFFQLDYMIEHNAWINDEEALRMMKELSVNAEKNESSSKCDQQ